MLSSRRFQPGTTGILFQDLHLAPPHLHISSCRSFMPRPWRIAKLSLGLSGQNTFAHKSWKTLTRIRINDWGWGWSFLSDKFVSCYLLQLKSKLLGMSKNWLPLVILASNDWWWTWNLYCWCRSHYKVSGLKWFCHRCPSSGPCRSIESQQDEINLSWNNIGPEGAKPDVWHNSLWLQVSENHVMKMES